MKTPSAFILVLLFYYGSVQAQTTNSPYSILGIGDIETDYYNRTAGTANTGQAYRSERFLINNNPASYTALQQQFFSFEIAGRGQFANYSGSPLYGSSAANKDFAIKHLSVGTKICKWWGSSAGMLPYSSSNYSFTSLKNIQGTNSTVPANYDGSGGINQVYWANAFEPFRHFSVGIHAAYLFGSLTQTEDLVTDGLQTTLTTSRQTFYKNFNFTYGAQYYVPIGSWDINLGATYAPSHLLAADATVTVTDNGTQVSSVTDKSRNFDFKLPDASGFGFSITKNKKYTFSADYKYQAWTAAHNFVGANASLKDSRRASVGFEISNKKVLYNTLFERNYLQAGLYYGSSYLQVNGRQLDEMGLTLGYGINSKRNPQLGLSLGLDVGQRGTKQAGLIKENYVNIIIAVSYRDLWRTRGIRYF